MQKEVKELIWEPYEEQKRLWPQTGRHVSAHFDDDSVVVYQAYNKTIASYATEHHKFSDCPGYNEKRMTWIKPNFLWMMFRSGWGRKSGRILAIWIKKEAFFRYLSQSVHTAFEEEVYETKGEFKHQLKEKRKDDFGFVRVQWDPDHDPHGEPLGFRRAIQLGLKGVNSFIGGEDIIQIQDISKQVAEQQKFVGKRRLDPRLLMPRERELVIDDVKLYHHLKITDNPHDHMVEIKKEGGSVGGRRRRGDADEDDEF